MHECPNCNVFCQTLLAFGYQQRQAGGLAHLTPSLKCKLRFFLSVLSQASELLLHKLDIIYYKNIFHEVQP